LKIFFVKLEKILGYHGTSLQNAKTIINEGFEPSLGDDHWLGNGVYFFIEGISKNPNLNAEKWAVVEAWDKKNKSLKYTQVGVIKAEIQVDKNNFLDLTTSDGVEILNYILESHKKTLKEKSKNISFLDGLILNFAKQEGILDFDVVKGNFYFKFDAESRKEDIKFRTPNCTICSVISPNKNIIDLEIVKEKNIEDEIN
jgi:hypothetical protein